MVGHEAVAQQDDLAALNVLSQKFEVYLAVCIAIQNEAARITALGNRKNAGQTEQTLKRTHLCKKLPDRCTKDLTSA
jgi:hypothetical protein